MARAWGRSFGLALAGLFVACSGGTSAGCGGCGTPLDGDFPRDVRVPNAGAVRVTRTGLDFLAENGATVAGSAITGQPSKSGPATFPIPTSTQTGHADVPVGIGTVPIDYTIHICPDGAKPTANPPTCLGEIDLQTTKLKIDALAPNALRLRGDFPIRMRDLPLKVEASGASFTAGVGFGKASGSGCLGAMPTVDYKTFPIDITLPFVAETNLPRDGYTKIDVDNAVVHATLAKDDITICGDCGFVLNSLGVCSFLVQQAKDSAYQSFGGDAFGQQLKAQLKSGVCEKPNPAKTPACPAGTTEKDGVCVYPQAPTVCASTILGSASHMETGATTAADAGADAAPPPASTNAVPSKGGLDLLFAAYGGLDSAPGAVADDAGYEGHTPNGLTFPLFGGANVNPKSPCVPDYSPTLPLGIPVPDELRANAITPWPGATPPPHLGIALAGRFLDYAFGGLYAAGSLCLTANTDQTDQLKTGVLSLIIPSLKNLTFEQKGAAMAITTRPGAPPHLTLGSGADLKTDPLIKVKLERFAIDFYVYTIDRYLRVFTFTSDLTLPVNLQTGKDPVKNPSGGIVPVLGDLVVENPSVSATTLLAEDPAKIAGSLSTLVGGLTSQLTGSIAPVDLSSALSAQGLALTIPETGIRRITKNEDAFLAIFANLAVATNPAKIVRPNVRLTALHVDPSAMGLATLRRETRPTLELALGSSLDDTGALTEWSVQIDQGARSPWSSERHTVVARDDLALQGRHVLRVFARAAGDPTTESATPAEVPFVVDVLAPNVRLREPTRGGPVLVDAFDFVSDVSALRARVRRRGGKLDDEAFGPLVPLADVAAIDAQGARSVEIEVVDESGNVARADLALGAAPAAPGTSGCSCEAAGARGTARGVGPLVLAAAFVIAMRLRRRGRRSLVPATALAAAALAAGLPACSCGDDAEAEPLCGTDCKQACKPALPLGMIGAYTSVAKTKSGDLWVAGYADASIDEDGTMLYGDLVVGRFDAAKGTVAWQAVDGVPKRTDGTCPVNDRHGFRGGESDSGDDVGLHTSLALTDADEPIVSYYDATHHALKVALHDGTNGWQSYALFGKPGQDAGRAAKIAIVDGKPVIVFLVLESGGQGGKLRSRIAVAKATTARPTDTSKWTFDDLAQDDATPCRPEMCSSSEACAKDTQACEKTVNGCGDACKTGTACVIRNGAPACTAVLNDPAVATLPNALAAELSIGVGPKGLGVVAYDRAHGNLVAYSPNGSAYARRVVAGADENGVDTGDVGRAAALAIAPDGRWHVAAIDDRRGALMHYWVDEGRALAEDVIDDGSGYPDGLHRVGDDAVIRADESGVTVCYQDATVGELRCASGSPDVQGKTAFARSTVAQPGRTAGFFPRFVPGERKIVNHWRALDKATLTYSGDVSVLTF